MSRLGMNLYWKELLSKKWFGRIGSKCRSGVTLIVARRLGNRFCADLAYISLKPAEGITAVSVRLVGGNAASQIVNELYRRRSQGRNNKGH